MKLATASIIVIAAAVLITGGSFIPHGDTKLIAQAVGFLVGVIGLGGWFASFIGDEERMSPNNTDTRRTARLRFGLRRLFLFVTLFAVVSAFVGNRWRQETAWRRATAPVTSAGGSVAWVAGTSRWPENAASICLDGSSITDDGLAHLKQFPNAVVLHLDNTRVSDSGLPHLKSLRSLEYIDLRGSDVTSSGVRDLRISLPNTQIDY